MIIFHQPSGVTFRALTDGALRQARYAQSMRLIRHEDQNVVATLRPRIIFDSDRHTGIFFARNLYKTTVKQRALAAYYDANQDFRQEVLR